MQCLFCVEMNFTRNDSVRNTSFFLAVIDDIYQSVVAIECLAKEGIRNTIRRELRYLIELSVKACLISQKNSESSTREQVDEFRKIIKDTNITMVKDVDFHYFDDKGKSDFVTMTKRVYGECCNYSHVTIKQINERFKLEDSGRTIGFEGTQELRELNDEIGQALSIVVILFFHAIPIWCVGDYLVDSDGTTTKFYYTKYEFISKIDECFDYKFERQANVDEVKKIRTERVVY
ncbi:MAG: hypothetical protein ACK5LV_00640 [Lachnospirales bacterium]